MEVADAKSKRTKITLMLGAFLDRFVPVIALSYFSIQIMIIVSRAGKHRKRLQQSNIQPSDIHARKRPTSGMLFTNQMILAMLLLYILIMLPNGIVVLLIGILGPPFHLNVFLPLQELFILMFMMLCNMNFFFLISMSHSFRTTFISMFGLQSNSAASPGTSSQW